MYARVISVKAKKGMLQAALKLAEKVVVPAAQRYAGFHHWCQMSDPTTNNTVSIALWGNEEDMITFGQKDMQRIFGQMDQLMDFDTMEAKTYHVDIMAEAIPELIVDQIGDAILESA
ncbi:MAG: hypothetical protein DWQ04_21425 [Chloroflexi bacterium]|nr:MAG: hypothetical protein DWQ04_21425 [Chloroflexota bacterium]